MLQMGRIVLKATKVFDICRCRFILGACSRRSRLQVLARKVHAATRFLHRSTRETITPSDDSKDVPQVGQSKEASTDGAAVS